ncbi:hypothetical protein OCU04_008211 [Sclerotinia nivalis]|uniref:Uncharacterized protein n=1 Tax=Sclerotinia nivalis TaxID=352851 RepID=A0A9X0AII1_9HELO|nr:hypothetical protein OCU04_008211 [Sclerotinia nivalis]
MKAPDASKTWYKLIIFPQSIKKISDQLGANDLDGRILNSAIDPFRWDVSSSISASNTSATGNLGASSKQNPQSINALLNAVDYIAESKQGQQSSSIANSSVASCNREDSTDSESHKKRRRDDSFPSYDSSLAQQASELAVKDLSLSLPLTEMTHEQGGVSANQPYTGRCGL